MGKTFMIRNFEIATEGSKAPLKVVVMENQLTIQHDLVSNYQNGHYVFQTIEISMICMDKCFTQHLQICFP